MNRRSLRLEKLLLNCTIANMSIMSIASNLRFFKEIVVPFVEPWLSHDGSNIPSGFTIGANFDIFLGVSLPDVVKNF